MLLVVFLSIGAMTEWIAMRTKAERENLDARIFDRVCEELTTQELSSALAPSGERREFFATDAVERCGVLGEWQRVHEGAGLLGLRSGATTPLLQRVLGAESCSGWMSPEVFGYCSGRHMLGADRFETIRTCEAEWQMDWPMATAVVNHIAPAARLGAGDDRDA